MILIMYVELLQFKLMYKLHMPKKLRASLRWPTTNAETCRSIY